MLKSVAVNLNKSSVSLRDFSCQIVLLFTPLEFFKSVLADGFYIIIIIIIIHLFSVWLVFETVTFQIS